LTEAYFLLLLMSLSSVIHMSGLRIDKTNWNSVSGTTKIRPHLKPYNPFPGKLFDNFMKFIEGGKIKPINDSIEKPTCDFTNTMLNDRIDLKDENCLNISLGGK
jgi:hypothetical protein